MNAVVAMHDTFVSALLDPRRVAPGLDNATDAAGGFGVHRNNVMVALVDALASAFPVTLALVGEDFFRAMAGEYVRIDPPRSPIMALYGGGFPDFIEGHVPASSIEYLADVARLEHLRVEAFHAADGDGLNSTQWSALLADPVQLASTRIRLQRACRWLSSAYPILSIWQAHQYPDAQRDVVLAALDLGEREDVLVHRPQWDVQQVSLPEGGILWLDALHAGATLGDALQHVDATIPEAAPSLLFALLLQHGLVTAIEPDKEKPHA